MTTVLTIVAIYAGWSVVVAVVRTYDHVRYGRPLLPSGAQKPEHPHE